jgi:hypothetical protein
MSAISTIGVFDFAAGTLAALGLAYLLVSESVVVHYRSFFRTTALGLFAFAATGPVVGTLAPSLIHAVHGFAALVVTVALYRLVRESIDRDASFGAPAADSAFDLDADADFDD